MTSGRAALLTFLFVFVAHLASPVMTSTDSKWSVFGAESLLRTGDFNLDEYQDVLERENRFAIERFHGHDYAIFPIGPSLVALPVVAVVDLSLRAACAVSPSARAALEARLHKEGRDVTRIDATAISRTVERIVAALVVAASASVLLLIALRRTSLRASLVLAGVFAFGTAAWSTASRGLWQHGPSMLALSLAMYAFLRARAAPRWFLGLGFFVAWAYVIRPTNSLAVLAFTVLVAFRHRARLPHYLAGAALVALPFLAYNLAVYGALLSPYYRPNRLGAETFGLALAGNLFSPARGLFVYTPIFLLCFARFRDKLDELEVVAVAVIATHWLVVSTFPHWWAGHSYDPRFMSDLTPFLVLLLVPVVERARSERTLAIGFGGLALISVAMHAHGAIYGAAHRWNSEPVNVDQHSERIWDWRDPPFLRR